MSRGFITCRNFSVAAILVFASTPLVTALAQTVGAVVDTEITELEIQQRSRLNELSTHKAPKREDVVRELQQEKLRIEEARKLGVDVPDADVDEVYAKMASRMRLTGEQLTQMLERSGIDAATLKHRIRADMVGQRYQQLRRPDPPLLRRQDPPPRDRGGG